MVVFSCGACGESVKKSQVEKHYTTKCRNCEFLSCVDCGKEFWGNDYAAHNKCMSEEEKTHGALYKKDPNANKGERKQELWTEQVRTALSKVKGNPSLTRLLEKLNDYPNIPRKKAKFENFVKNSLRVHDNRLLGQAWDSISAELEAKIEEKPVENSKVEKHEEKESDESKPITGKENEEKNLKRKSDEDDCQSDSKKQKTDLDDDKSTSIKWKSVIVEVLTEAPDHKMTIKKLRKKVLAKLMSNTDFSKDEMKEKFSKKLAKSSRVKISDDVVSLCD